MAPSLRRRLGDRHCTTPLRRGARRSSAQGWLNALRRDSRSSGRLKALDGFSLGIERIEQRQQTRDGQQIVIPSVYVQQLHGAIGLRNRSVGGHQFAEPPAIDVRHLPQIGDDLVRRCATRLLILSLRRPAASSIVSLPTMSSTVTCPMTRSSILMSTTVLLLSV